MMRRVLFLLLFIAMSIASNAVEVWCIQTQDSRQMRVCDVAFLLATGPDMTFSIVGRDGTMLNGVTEARFVKLYELGINDVKGDEIFTQVVGDRLIVSGCTNGTSIAVSDLSGKRLLSDVVSHSETILDVSALPVGIYIISVGGVVVKFRKG